MPEVEPLAYKSKMDLLCQALTRRCHGLGPDTQLPAIRQLARDFQVSTGTLHHALAELERQQLIVRRHGQGIYVGKHVRSKNIAVVLGLDPARPTVSVSHGLIIESIRTRARRSRQAAELFIDLPYDEQPNLQRRILGAHLRSGAVDGVVVPASGGSDQIRWLQSFGKPLVMAGNGEVLDYSVRIDHDHLTRCAVETLVRAGCKRLAVISHVGSGIVAFAQQVQVAGVQTCPAWICQVCLQPDERLTRQARSFEELGFAAATSIWSNPASRPDGLVIGDEMLARGALLTLLRCGAGLGRQLRVCTHHTLGNPALAEVESLVQRLAIDPGKVGNAMFAMLNQLMDGRRPRARVRWIRAEFLPPVA